MWKRITFMIFLLCCISQSIQASQRIFVSGADPTTIRVLAGKGHLDILKYKPGRGVDCIADSEAIKSLKQSAYSIQIIVPDVEAYYTQKLSNYKYDFGQYYTYGEMVKELNSIHDNYPTITSPPEAIDMSGRIIDL